MELPFVGQSIEVWLSCGYTSFAPSYWAADRPKNRKGIPCNPLTTTCEPEEYLRGGGTFFRRRVLGKALKTLNRLQMGVSWKDSGRCQKLLRRVRHLLDVVDSCDDDTLLSELCLGSSLIQQACEAKARKTTVPNPCGAVKMTTGPGCGRQSNAGVQVTAHAGVKVLNTPHLDPLLDEAEVELHPVVAVSRLLNNLRAEVPCARNDADQQVCCDYLWQRLQEWLEVPPHLLTERCVKKDLDDMVEAAFGTMDNPRDDCCDKVTADMIFSLYLARKCLIVNPESELNASLKRFVTLIGNEDPEPYDQSMRDTGVKFIRRVAQDIFTRQAFNKFMKDDAAWVPTPNRACREGPVKRDLYWDVNEDRNAHPPILTVKPKAILSGGKIRVITIDSYTDVKFSPINTFMFRCLTAEKWIVSGRTVDDWVDQFTNELDGFLVSGDLQSATDTFSGDYARAVFLVLKETGVFTEEEYNRACAITTDASLEVDKKTFITQLRGQLMGSVLSFPILCLVSLTAWAVAYGHAEEYLRCACPYKRKLLRDNWILGVNGDDIVFPAKDFGASWIKGVRSVGGIVSRGKSLCSSRVFTLNSELWWRDSETSYFEPPGALRPSLLFGVLDGRKSNPEVLVRHWLDSELTSSVPEVVREIIERRLKMHLPRSMGGLGLTRRFVFADVADHMRTEREVKKIVRPPAYWAERHLRQLVHDRFYSAVVAVPRDGLEAITKWIRKPYVGLPEWSARGPVVTRKPLLNISEAAAREYYDRAWALEEAGLVEVRVPYRAFMEGDFDVYRPNRPKVDDVEDYTEYMDLCAQYWRKKDANESRAIWKGQRNVMSARFLVGLPKMVPCDQ